MKDPMRSVERFAYQHPRFGVPNLMRYIVGGNVLFWLAGVLLRNYTLLSYISFDAAAILHGQVWRLVTFMFYPISGSMLFALLSFYFYYWMGSTLEQYWGTPQFNIFILLGWFFTVVFGFAVYFITGNSPQITGTYLYYSLFFSYATLFPDVQVLLFMLIPVKMKWLAIVDALFFAYAVVSGFAWFPENLLPLVAVLNYFIFFGAELWQREERGTLQAQMLRLRADGCLQPGTGVSLLFPLRGLSLLLPGPYQQSHPFYGVIRPLERDSKKIEKK